MKQFSAVLRMLLERRTPWRLCIDDAADAAAVVAAAMLADEPVAL
jgi:hypothetical protein